MESPAIELGSGVNTLNVEIGASMFTFRTFAAPTYEMQDGEEFAIQLTKDGKEYVNILTINKDNMPAVEANEEEEIAAGNYFLNGVRTAYSVDFDQYAGETVKLRIYVKRYTNGRLDVANLSLTNGATVGIGEFATSERVAGSIFNLSGQRLVAPQKGLNIINGHKVLVK